MGGKFWEVVCWIQLKVYDVEHVANKRDSFVNDFKMLKDYLDQSGILGKWWSLFKLEKKQISRERRLPLEFTHTMFLALEGWYGLRGILAKP